MYNEISNTTFNPYITIPTQTPSDDTYWKTTYATLENKYYNMALTRFEYKGLPETIDAMTLEQMLMYNGYAAFIQIGGKLYALPVTAQINTSAMFGFRPNKVELYTDYGDDKDAIVPDNIKAFVKPEYHNGLDTVVMGNDSRYLPSYQQITQFIVPMTNLYVQRINNEVKLSTPIVIETNDQNTDIYQAQMVMNALHDNQFSIIASGDGKAKELANTQVIDYSEHYLGDQIAQAIDFYDTQIKELLSKNNFSRTTESGISEGEIDEQGDGNHSNGLMAYKMRYKAIQEINKMFGTNITIDWRDSDEVQKHTNTDTREPVDEQLPGE